MSARVLYTDSKSWMFGTVGAQCGSKKTRLGSNPDFRNIILIKCLVDHEVLKCFGVLGKSNNLVLISCLNVFVYSPYFNIHNIYYWNQRFWMQFDPVGHCAQ